MLHQGPGCEYLRCFAKPKKKKEVEQLRKFMMLGALVALVVAALAIPALAQDVLFRGDQEDRLEARQDRLEERVERFQERFEDRLEEEGLFFFAEDGFFFGEDGFDDDDFDNNNGVSQNFNQEAQGGDVNQSFNVSNRGDNSNQCVGISGVANTGNAQNQVGVIQYGSEADDFDFEDVGASLNVSGSSTTSCEQRVNQAAAAG